MLKKDSDMTPEKIDSKSIYPYLMTKQELIKYLRIDVVSKATNHNNVIANLKRVHDLPRVNLCGRSLYPREKINEWIMKNTRN